MSKKHGASRKRRRAMARQPLAVLARVLNEAEAGGLNPRIRHGAIWCDLGVVLPPEAPGRAWVARKFRSIGR